MSEASKKLGKKFASGASVVKVSTMMLVIALSDDMKIICAFRAIHLMSLISNLTTIVIYFRNGFKFDGSESNNSNIRIIDWLVLICDFCPYSSELKVVTRMWAIALFFSRVQPRKNK